MKMRVAELWRHPVKSLVGEPLDSAEISADGIHKWLVLDLPLVAPTR